MSSKPFHGLTVLEVSSGYAAGLCGRLLQQHGADVIRVVTDQPEGVERTTRIWLDQGKRVIGAEQLDRQIVADIVLVDLSPAVDRAEWDPERLNRERPNAIIASITPFGESGPWREYRVDALALDALSGLFLLRGSADRAPVSMPRYVAELAGGFTAYIGITAAILRRERGLAGGEIVDISLFESCLGCSELTWSAFVYLSRLDSRGNGNGILGMMPCSNGYCEAYLWGDDSWTTFGALLGDEEFAGMAISNYQADPGMVARVRERSRPWFQERTKQQAMHEAQELRLHFGYSASIPDLLDDPQVRERGTLATLDVDGQQIQVPDIPFAVGRGEGNSGPLTWPAIGSAPLSGVTIVDMTIFWAGPVAARLLADLGADVIKVEGPSRPDPVRNQMPKDGIYDEEHKWERGWWNGLNVGKRSLALELSRPEARELLLKVATRADILFENFSRRVLPNFGLDWPRLREASGSLSLVSSSAFGRTGPYRDYIAFGSNLEPLTGISELCGYADGSPEIVASNICDPIAGLANGAALLTVLLDRVRTGTVGSRTEVVQRDALACALPWAYGDYQLDGRVPKRDGNRRAGMLVHDCFPCSGIEQYVAISCGTPDERDALCRAIGFSDATGHEGGVAATSAPLIAAIADWCRGRTKFEAFHALQAAGVIAAPLLDARDIDENPQLAARGFFRTITTAAGFLQRAMTYGFRFLRTPLHLTDRAPRFGEHNAAILRWAGLDDQQIADTAREGLIADQPNAVFVGPIAPDVQTKGPK